MTDHVINVIILKFLYDKIDSKDKDAPMKKTKIIDESLKEEDSFSSCAHAIDTIAADSYAYKADHYKIPNKYHKDTLVIMPINTKKYYLYWEITKDLLKKYSINNCQEIIFRIIDECERIVFEIKCHDELSEYFINNEFDGQHIMVHAGFYQKNDFITILHSNKLKVFDRKLKFSEKQKEVWIKKEKGFTEVIRASMQHFTLGLSSASYVEEIERLKQGSRLAI